MELKLEGITKSYTKGKKRKNALEDFTLTLTEGVRSRRPQVRQQG